MARLLVALLAACATAVVVAVGITAHSDDDKPSTHPTTAPTPSPAATPPAAPRVGDCHELTLHGAAAATDSSAPVSCRSAHTAVTIYVGRFDPVVDGHLLAVDSAHVQQQLATRCPRHLAPYVGGSETGRRLSRFSVVWFGPTVAEEDAGARWFRCDLVALAGHDQLALLSARMHGVLDRRHALAHWGTCGTRAPDAAHFERVLCAHTHRWRATDVVKLSKHARYLGKAAASRANDECQAVAADHAGGSLKYTWSFEWPTRAQWADGRRYGFCWLPTT